MKHATVVDGQGKNWVIYPGDSAWRQCLSLLRAGVAEVVLPRDTLLRGVLPMPESIFVPDVPIEVVRMSATLQTIMLRQIRLKDCVQWLALNELFKSNSQPGERMSIGSPRTNVRPQALNSRSKRP